VSLSNYVENAIINWFRGTDFPAAPPALYTALFTVDATEAGGGTEASYPGYARQTVSLTAPPGPVSNQGPVAWAAVAGATTTITGVGLYDAASGGNQLAYDNTMTDKAVPVGDVPEFAAGALTFDVD
jgi:hypothetical protein